jgi:hypothetical protein
MKAWNPELSPAQLGAWRRRTAGFAVVLLLAALWAARMNAPATALYLVQAQDFPVLVVASLACFLVALWQPRWALPARLPSPTVLLLAGFGLVALLAWGSYALMGNFPLSRDEHMVLFDMAVFDHGRPAMPIPAQWRPFALALVPEFLVRPDHPIGFASFYLPMNAALRLAFSKIADPAWFDPLLVLLGGAALLDIAKRTFGPDDRACWVVLLVYALSAQVLVNAMTSYSMSAHLALNLVWLAAFLRGGKFWTAVAIITGFVATGLHQLVFHPFFVAPFLLWKLRERQWKLVLVYAAAYAVIVGWWAYYPIMISPLVARRAAQASASLLGGQAGVLLNRDPRAVSLMLLNLMRFIGWQNLALCPLLIAAMPVALRERGLARALILGIVMWLVFLTVFVPSQGRGWGYRYLHGYIGSFALLAGFGYRELERRIGGQADGLVVLMSGLTAVVAIPLLFTATYRFMQPHLSMQRLIEAQSTPFVLVDDTDSDALDGGWTDTARDHVRNLPDLSNRPLRFSAAKLNPALLAELCRRGPVTVITRADMHRQGFLMNVPERSPSFEALTASAHPSPGCLRAADTARS